jgi:hypothetical protein
VENPKSEIRNPKSEIDRLSPRQVRTVVAPECAAVVVGDAAEAAGDIDDHPAASAPDFSRSAYRQRSRILSSHCNSNNSPPLPISHARQTKKFSFIVVARRW